jgi:2-methylisocitrate lyase-like PEP mutase family enzyme
VTEAIERALDVLTGIRRITDLPGTFDMEAGFSAPVDGALYG